MYAPMRICRDPDLNFVGTADPNPIPEFTRANLKNVSMYDKRYLLSVIYNTTDKNAFQY